eukprot:CAMPEP_0180277488 /NCGR_PEP_ID=MMETSP0988-20121125/6953_1 /TAXON_ID=697907 /ORGANISM="non described non described, Strain CCMP2293" /LENGTH=170 /DNA_ID=CAMNT_0022248925 /DNA_START=48 /DNA_END=561 /DNA_ORIENTATION=+
MEATLPGSERAPESRAASHRVGAKTTPSLARLARPRPTAHRYPRRRRVQGNPLALLRGNLLALRGAAPRVFCALVFCVAVRRVHRDADAQLLNESRVALHRARRHLEAPELCAVMLGERGFKRDMSALYFVIRPMTSSAASSAASSLQVGARLSSGKSVMAAVGEGGGIV